MAKLMGVYFCERRSVRVPLLSQKSANCRLPSQWTIGEIAPRPPLYFNIGCCFLTNFLIKMQLVNFVGKENSRSTILPRRPLESVFKWFFNAQTFTFSSSSSLHLMWVRGNHNEKRQPSGSESRVKKKRHRSEGLYICVLACFNAHFP